MPWPWDRWRIRRKQEEVSKECELRKSASEEKSVRDSIEHKLGRCENPEAVSATANEPWEGLADPCQATTPSYRILPGDNIGRTRQTSSKATATRNAYHAAGETCFAWTHLPVLLSFRSCANKIANQ